MAARVSEEEKASENRQRKREAEETDKVEVASGLCLYTLARGKVVSLEQVLQRTYH